jgi:hypothetical protein
MGEAIMTENHDTRTSSAISRRAALRSAPALGAVALLPAGAAVAATVAGDADHGLAAIEAGYARWCALLEERDRLQQRRDDLAARARADRPMLETAPVVPKKLEPYAFPWGNDYVSISMGMVPERLRKLADVYTEAEVDWRKRHPSLEGHPDYEASLDAHADAEDCQEEADKVRDEVLAMPARSPRGILIKMAIGAESRTLDGIEAVLADCDWPVDDLFPPLLADLRAMIGGALA